MQTGFVKFTSGQLVLCKSFTNVYSSPEKGNTDKYGVLLECPMIVIEVVESGNVSLVNVLVPELCIVGWVLPSQLMSMHGQRSVCNVSPSEVR